MLVVCVSARADSVEVITSSDRSMVELDRTLLLALFTMRVRQWPDGRQARVFVLPDDSSLHEQFCRDVLGTYPYVLHNAWERMVYTGTGQSPTVVHSEEEMKDKVRSTSGAIGYARVGVKAPAPPMRGATTTSSKSSP